MSIPTQSNPPASTETAPGSATPSTAPSSTVRWSSADGSSGSSPVGCSPRQRRRHQPACVLTMIRRTYGAEDHVHRLGEFTSYREAERMVDRLADVGFPVERVRIVGTGLRSVEQVTGRLTKGGATLIGA